MINARTKKIDAIKALRVFCVETFGITGGLKEGKDFIDHLVRLLPPELEIGQRYKESVGIDMWVILSFDYVEVKAVKTSTGQIEWLGRFRFEGPEKTFDLVAKTF